MARPKRTTPGRPAPPGVPVPEILGPMAAAGPPALVPRPAFPPPATAAGPGPILDLHAAFTAGMKPSTARAYQADLRDFARFLGVGTGRHAEAELLAGGPQGAYGLALAYSADMTDRRKLAPATVARRLAALRSFVGRARRLGVVPWVLEIEGPRVTPYRDTRGPTLDEWRSLMRAADRQRDPAKAARDGAILRLLRDQAIRRGECCALTIADLELDHPDAPAVWIIGKGKSEKERITINRPTMAAIRDWLSHRGGGPGPLFTRCDNADRGGPPKAIDGRSVVKLLAALSRRAGLSRAVRPHGLRHQGITRALDVSGGNTRNAQKFSRHADPKTLNRYDDNRKDEAGSLARMIGEDYQA